MNNRYIKILFICLWISSTFTGCEHNSDIPLSQIRNENISVQSTSTDTGVKQNTTAETFSTSDFRQKNADKIKITFIELGSVNCIPCKMMQPVMEEIEKKYAGQIKVIFYDVWTPEGQPYGQIYKIRAIPTQVFLDEKSNEFHRHEGFYSFDEIKKVFAQKGVN